MLSSAIIVFREVFEIVFILGIVLAATKGLPHRGKSIALGLGGGVLGSALLALFTGKISELAEGVGQEIFNAGVLFTAAGFIGWTVLWMKRHGRAMKGKFEKLGQDVAEGSVPFITLSIVIALTILREGSEIVLFSYGMLAAGQSPSTLLGGATIGFVGGALIGTLLYVGLVQLSTKHFFQITGGLLMLLVAGMMVQGVGFLTAAGLFNNTLSQQMWDSGWLIGEDGLLGQTLKALLGYTAQPTLVQLLTYILTIGTLIMLTKTYNKKLAIAVLTGIGMGFALTPTPAHATKKVYTPYVEQGELEIESKTGYTIDDNADTDGAWKQKLAVGYGMTPYWFTEVYGEVEKDGDEGGSKARFTAVEWENKFQLTQPGEFFVDTGAMLSLERNTVGGADKGEFLILLAKDTGDFTHTANIIAEREFGNHAADQTEFGAAWSSRYRLAESFEPGFEIHSNFGALDNGSSFNEESHQIGPVAYGKIGPFKYDVGYLAGVSQGAPDGTVKAILEYEMRF